MHSRKIVTLFRIGRTADDLVKQDAGALTERLVQRSSLAGQREEVVAYLDELYKEVAQMLALEHSLRVASNLDAGQARSNWAVLRRALEAISGASRLPRDVREQIAITLAAIPAPPAPEEPDVEQSTTAAPAPSHSR